MDLKKESLSSQHKQNDETGSITKLVETWSPSDWESWLDEQETASNEILFDDPCSVENHSQEAQDDFIRSTFEKKEYPALRQNLDGAIRSLTDKQQKILHLLFWENQSLKEVSLKYSITTAAVGRIRDRALKKLGAFLVQQVSHSQSSVSKLRADHETGVSKVSKLPIGREA